MKLEYSRQFFEKYSNIKFMEIRPVGAELFHSHGRTDKTKLIVAFRNFANAPKNYLYRTVAHRSQPDLFAENNVSEITCIPCT